ncbi:hypothetical protein ACJX0J_041088, partial [Zea mays]
MCCLYSGMIEITEGRSENTKLIGEGSQVLHQVQLTLIYETAQDYIVLIHLDQITYQGPLQRERRSVGVRRFS